MSIFNYSSAIHFLNDEIIKQKSETHFFSQRYLAKKLEVPASTLNAILNGNRKMSDKLKNKISEFLNFTEIERKYFELLTKIDNLDDIELKNILIDFKCLLIPAYDKRLTNAESESSIAVAENSIAKSSFLIENDQLFIRKDHINFTKTCFYELKTNLDILIGNLKELDKTQNSTDTNPYNIYIQVLPQYEG